MKQYGFVMVVTTELIVTVIAFIFLGQWLDSKFQWGPKGVITCTVVGSITGFTRFIMRLQKINEEPPPP
jgi:F0F1-type ATP synthase assembly protein I